nr:cytochrome c oxidase assembly protein COX20, mitochondrial [Pelodiscus sinensis]|eukprot:XP_025046599.1 cytochrome c oxidase assembly protein COX20, mitochondrial [Pelodiscus sinensis]
MATELLHEEDYISGALYTRVLPAALLESWLPVSIGGKESPPWRSPPCSGSGKSFKLLGILDVQNIPCARESVLYGSLGSLVAGLGHFLATSRVRRSFHFGMGGFVLTTLGCWVYCRYNHAKLRIQQRIIQEGMRNKILYESSDFDPESKQNKSQGSHS